MTDARLSVTLPEYKTGLAAPRRTAMRNAARPPAPLLVAFTFLDRATTPPFWLSLLGVRLAAASVLGLIARLSQMLSPAFPLTVISVAVICSTIEAGVFATGGAHSAYLTSNIAVLAGVGILMPLTALQAAIVQLVGLGIALVPLLFRMQPGDGLPLIAPASYLLAISIVAGSRPPPKDTPPLREHRARHTVPRLTGLIILEILPGGPARARRDGRGAQGCAADRSHRGRAGFRFRRGGGHGSGNSGPAPGAHLRAVLQHEGRERERSRALDLLGDRSDARRGAGCPVRRERGSVQAHVPGRSARRRCGVSQDLNVRDRASLRRARLGLRRRDLLLLLRGMTAIDAIAQLLAGAEEDPALRLDRDHLSGLGVTAVVPLVVLDVERAKTADFDVVSPAEGRLHRLEDRLDGELSLLLRQLALGHQDGDQITLQHACTPRGPAVENVRRMGTLHERPGREQAPICMNFRRAYAHFAPPRAGGDPELAPRSRRGAPRTDAGTIRAIPPMPPGRRPRPGRGRTGRPR